MNEFGRTRHALKRYELYLDRLRDASDASRYEEAVKLTDKIFAERTIYVEGGGYQGDPRFKACEAQFRHLRRLRPTKRQMCYLRGLGHDGGVFDLTHEQAGALIQSVHDAERLRLARIAACGHIHRFGSVSVSDLAPAYGQSVAQQVIREIEHA